MTTTTKFVTLPSGSTNAPDEPGTLGAAARVLYDQGINIEAFATEASGIRLRTSSPEKAVRVLSDAGYEPETVECFELHVPNQPGELARIGEALGKANVNIVSCFGSAAGGSGQIYLRVDDPETAAPILERLTRQTVQTR
ncbi:MAG: ACT domain-containing protein [bacterium]